LRKNCYLHPGDSIPEGKPKQHVRSDDGRLILYWDLPEKRVFLQAYDSLGNYRVVDGIVQAPKKVYSCAICRTNRSPDQICSHCRQSYSISGQLPVWVQELIKIQDRAIQNGYQVQSLDAFPTGPPLRASRWPLNQSKAFTEANQLILSAQREAELDSSSSGIKLSDYRLLSPPLRSERRLRWNGYRLA